MRVLMLSKACIVGIYQRKLEAIAAAPDIELRTLVPPSWKDEQGEIQLERLYTTGYDLVTTPIRFNGNYHLHFYPQFNQHLRDFKPDIVHVDEEPYNLATWLAVRAARNTGAKTLFFSWQNINRRYPLPFNILEKQVINSVDHAIVGTESAATVWREKGYTGNMTVIPQFGVDPELFTIAEAAPQDHQSLRIGYVGRLWHGKGIDTLIDALNQLQALPWELHIIGSGQEEASIMEQIRGYGFSDRLHLTNWVPSVQMPGMMRSLDILVLPSRTLNSWKEQYGRVIVEAMASGVVVVGSSSGAIPDVIGDAGLVFEEGNAESLANHLHRLVKDNEIRNQYAMAGRGRVLQHFTQAQVAQSTVAVYHQMSNHE